MAFVRVEQRNAHLAGAVRLHTVEGRDQYANFSLWDTYRALHPLLTLIQPEQRNVDFVRSLIASLTGAGIGGDMVQHHILQSKKIF